MGIKEGFFISMTSEVQIGNWGCDYLIMKFIKCRCILSSNQKLQSSLNYHLTN